MSENPLKSFIRQPQIYVRLPSNGRFNKEKVNFTANYEIPVRATTSTDDLLLRNPDALLNGDAIEKVLKSCVPEIPNIRETPANDIDVLLLAIQYATKGDKFEFKETCPKCGNENTYEKSIRTMIESITEIPEINSISYIEGHESDIKKQTEITVIVRPYSFENNTKASLIEYDSQKRMKYIKALYEVSLTNENSSDELFKIQQQERTEHLIRQQVTEAYTAMADLALNLISDSILQINIKSADNSPIIVTNKEHILEYVKNLTSDKQALIKNKLDEIMSYGLEKKPKLTCSAVISETVENLETKESKIVESICGNEWEKREVGYDQSNFFGPTFAN